MEYEIIRDPARDRKQVLTSRQLVEMIVEAGRDPVERDPLYNIISRGFRGRDQRGKLALGPIRRRRTQRARISTFSVS